MRRGGGVSRTEALTFHVCNFRFPSTPALPSGNAARSVLVWLQTAANAGLVDQDSSPTAIPALSANDRFSVIVGRATNGTLLFVGVPRRTKWSTVEW